MLTLDEYYTQLQIHEGATALPLVAAWLSPDIEAIIATFRAAFDAEDLRGAPVPIRDESTNQSIGNQVADFFIGLLHNRLPQHQVMPCPGAGYPDRALQSLVTGKTFPFELKATGNWDPVDSNRRVLTSSSRKLRERFRDPINHVLATVIYRRAALVYTVEGLRLDFLEPTTLVNVRLEGSVSHKLLARSQHRSLTI
jgi:hypothetical protein